MRSLMSFMSHSFWRCNTYEICFSNRHCRVLIYGRALYAQMNKILGVVLFTSTMQIRNMLLQFVTLELK